MISDYMGNGSFFREDGGLQPTCDVWGTILPPSDDTGKGNVRVKVGTMKDKMDVFDKVPVLTNYGGDNYGAFFLPEEGDIVRLTFLGGDFRHPVVAGCRFPQDSKLVGDACGKENYDKLLKVKNGSRIVFSGEKGKEKIEISGPQKMEWQLDEENERITFGDSGQKNRVALDNKGGKAQITSENSIELKCGDSVLELKKDGTIAIKCKQMTLEAQNIKITGKTKTEIDGQQLTISGNTGITVKGAGQVKVESKGQLKLSGAVIQLN